MSYNPTKWTDQVLSDSSYTLKQNSNGTYDINAAGKVISQGTPMSAENFNHIEQGITTTESEIAINKSSIGMQKKNLWKPIGVSSASGVTITVDSDGKISGTGTTTGQITKNLSSSFPSGSALYINGADVLTGITYMAAIKPAGGTTVYKSIGTAGLSVAATEQISYIYVQQSSTGKAVDFEIYPMVTYKEVTDRTYEQYADDLQTQINNKLGVNDTAANANSAATATRAYSLMQKIRHTDTSGVSNKHAKLATITFSATWIGNTIRLFVVDAANGNANSEIIINARANGTTGGYVVNPTLRVNSAGVWGKSMYYLMYTGWSIELWCTCGTTDVINMEISEFFKDAIPTVTIAYEQSLTWQTDAPTSGTKVSAIDAFSNYLPKTGTAADATKLATPVTIDGVSFDGSVAIAHYGTCSTAAGTAAKVVTLPNFTLVTGAKITVFFTVTNTADNVSLNVNGTGAKLVYYMDSAITPRLLKLQANMAASFVYNGTNWVYVGEQSYVSQTNATINEDRRLLLSTTADDTQDRNGVNKSAKFTANPSTGVLTAQYIKTTGGGKVLASGGFASGTNPITITIADAAKYEILIISIRAAGIYGATSYINGTLPIKYMQSSHEYIKIGPIVTSKATGSGNTGSLYDISGYVDVGFPSTTSPNMLLIAMSNADNISGIDYTIYAP